MMTHLTVALAVTLAAVALRQADESPAPPLLQTRVVSARVAGMTDGAATLELVVGLTASRPATLRQVVFKDSTAGEVPIAIDAIAGRWRLAAATELVLDTPVRVRLHVREARRLRAALTLLSQDTVPVRSQIEATFDPPVLARVLLMHRSRVAVAMTTLDVNWRDLLAGSNGVLRLGADVLALAGSALPFLEQLQAARPGDRAALQRLSATTATVTTTYAVVDAQKERRQRVVQSVGFWWSADTMCTTREALEPWRFDVTDAIDISRGGAVEMPAVVHEIASADRRHRLDAAGLLAELPTVRGRTVMLVDGSELRRGRLLDRDDASNIACLRGIGGSPLTAQPVLADQFPASAAEPASGAIDVVATDVRRQGTDLLLLDVPVGARSFGSPLLTAGANAAGIVVSSRRALPSIRIARAAASATPVVVLASQSRQNARILVPQPQ